MQRTLTAALAAAALLALSAPPSQAQTASPAPLPSTEASAQPAAASPAAETSAEPVARPHAEPSPVESAEPSPPPSTKRGLHGVVKALNGTKAVLRLADGTTRTFNVSSKTAALLKAHLGKGVVYRVVDGALTLAP